MRIRPGRSVTSMRDGDVNAMDQGTSRPATKVSALRERPSAVRITRESWALQDAGDAAIRARTRRRFKTRAGLPPSPRPSPPALAGGEGALSRLRGIGDPGEAAGEVFPGQAAMGDTVLLLVRHLGEGESGAGRDEEAVPAEAPGAPGGGRDRSGDFSASLLDSRPVVPGDHASRRRR